MGGGDDDAWFDALVERSSLGAAGARRLRTRTSPAEADTARRIADLHDRVPHGSGEDAAEAARSLARLLHEVGYEERDGEVPAVPTAAGAEPTPPPTNRELLITSATAGAHEDEAVTLLRATTLLKELDEADLRRLAGRAATRRFRRGQVVFTEGEPSDTVLVVARGRLKILTKAVDGRDHVFNIAGPGETLGELNIVEAGPRTASVEALEPSVVLLLDRNSVWELVRERPAVAEQLIRALAAHIRRLTAANADLVFLDLPRRVAKLLLMRHREAGRPVIELGLTQTEIASLLGGSRQSVNQALRDFERRNWILTEGQTITIIQLDRLRRLAGE